MKDIVRVIWRDRPRKRNALVPEAYIMGAVVVVSWVNALLHFP